MVSTSCSHSWVMANVVYGFVITEKCSSCEVISTYFTFEDWPPLEEYREGEHFWNVVESAQSFRFDLQCQACGHSVSFDELMGLSLCTGCDATCQMDSLRKRLEKDRTWLYIAFGFLPTSDHSQLTAEKIAILETFFNQRQKSSRSKIKIVSPENVKNYATCYGEVIKDVNLLSLTPPDEES